MNGITNKQRTVLRYVHNYTLLHGYPPSLREIALHIGVNCPATAADHLRALAVKGLVVREPGGRCLRLTGEGREAIAG